MNEINALIRNDQRTSFLLCENTKRSQLCNGRGLSSGPDCAKTLNSDFQPLQLWGTSTVLYICTYKLWTFKDANVCSLVQSCKSVHMSGIHCHSRHHLQVIVLLCTIVYSMYRIQLYTIFISSVCFLCVIYEKSTIKPIILVGYLG